MWFDLQQCRSFCSKFRYFGCSVSEEWSWAYQCRSTFHQWQKIIKIQIVSVFPVQIFCFMFRMMMLILNPHFFVAIISQIQMFHAPNIFYFQNLSNPLMTYIDLLHQFLECQCLPSWSMVHVILNIESQQPTYMTNSIKLNMLDGTDEDRKVRFASRHPYFVSLI